jgi:hypothetical protein
MRVYRAIVLVLLVSGCGPGWEGYADQYSDSAPVPSTPWEGEETVRVVLDAVNVEVALAGMTTYDYGGAAAVSLSELIAHSAVTGTPEDYRYDFTATDGYDLLTKRYGDASLLPAWTEMQGGYLYRDSRYDDLTCGWTEHPWGGALSAYQVKWMNGGTITLLPEP